MVHHQNNVNPCCKEPQSANFCLTSEGTVFSSIFGVEGCKGNAEYYNTVSISCTKAGTVAAAALY